VKLEVLRVAASLHKETHDQFLTILIMIRSVPDLFDRIKTRENGFSNKIKLACTFVVYKYFGYTLLVFVYNAHILIFFSPKEALWGLLEQQNFCFAILYLIY
jgi:hypothetical protein